MHLESSSTKQSSSVLIASSGSTFACSFSLCFCSHCSVCCSVVLFRYSPVTRTPTVLAAAKRGTSSASTIRRTRNVRIVAQACSAARLREALCKPRHGLGHPLDDLVRGLVAKRCADL